MYSIYFGIVVIGCTAEYLMDCYDLVGGYIN